MKDILGIIYAMDKESEGYSDFLSSSVTKKLYGIEFRSVVLGENRIAVFVKSGIGKTNAAMIATLLIEHFHVTRIIVSGIAGSLSADLKMYDALVASRFVQHDMENVGEEYGYIDGLGVVYIDADKAFGDRIAKILSAKRGLLASGDQFITGKEMKNKILERFPDTVAVDMESGAVAQVCARAKIPMVCVKVISDGGDDVEYEKFACEAGRKLTESVLTVIKNI